MRTFAVLAVVAFASGCLGSVEPGSSGDDAGSIPAWPYPTGNEWPAGLVGPFELGSILNHTLARPDGVEIFGSVLLPDVPEGTPVPTILEMGPYFDNEDDPTWSTEKVSVQEPYRPLDWIKEGYAVAYFSVRGTGRSTGCFEFGGAKETADSAAVVEWLSTQPWSNGRVGMMGLSYPGTTPIQAMSLNAPGLAAVAVMGTIVDVQWFYMTPQHEPSSFGAFFGSAYAGRVSIRPSPIEPGLPMRHPERFCPEVVDVLRGGQTMFASDQHDTQFWKDRRYRDRIPNATAAVFLQQGFDDSYNSGHIIQDRFLWELHPGPKRMFEGQWGHSTPPQENIERAYPDETYTSLTMTWFDYWLKGLGTPEQAGVGLVEYEDDTGGWHRDDAFPPFEAKKIYLNGRKGLSDDVTTGTAAFAATPGQGPAESTPCLANGERVSLAYVTEPATEDWLIAGNPDLDLLVDSSEVSGSLVAQLFHVRDDPGDGCKTGTWNAFSWGAANIRFYEGTGTGRDFPVGTPTPIHIQLSDFAEVIPAGERLGLVISGFEPFLRPPQAYPIYEIEEGPESFLTIHPVK